MLHCLSHFNGYSFQDKIEALKEDFCTLQHVSRKDIFSNSAYSPVFRDKFCNLPTRPRFFSRFALHRQKIVSFSETKIIPCHSRYYLPPQPPDNFALLTEKLYPFNISAP